MNKEMTEKELLDMKLHEMKEAPFWAITRVYSGWIYFDKSSQVAVFVPEHFN